jgi:toxin ParE1/3/4
VKIEVHPEADAELEIEVDFYNAQQEGLGDRFYREVKEWIVWIQANYEVPPERAGVRRVNLRKFPFYVIYILMEDSIRILAVGSGRRKPGYWMKRKVGL